MSAICNLDFAIMQKSDIGAKIFAAYYDVL